MEIQAAVKPLVLLVGCDGDRTARLRTCLEMEGMGVSQAHCGADAETAVVDIVHDVVVLFACGTGDDGLRLLAWARAHQAYAEFVVVAYDDSVDGAVAAFRSGAFDYHPRSAKDEILTASVMRAVENSGLHREVARLRRRLHAVTPGGIVGRSRQMDGVFDLMERVAPTAVPVLVTGETGTGKELVSRAIHDLSPRRRKGFVPVSCATVPEHIMESLLFGHVRGAFTGAVDTRKGLFEHAPGGTIFLDEIDTMGVDVQAKLLRVLEERTIRRVGDRQDIPVDFRLISASNKDLRELVERGSFREDLYFRLSAFPLVLPALRERPDDIPLLAVHFRDRFATETGLEPLAIHECCMDWLVEYSWPGNVRELKNTIERATLLSMDGSRITCESLKHLREDQASVSWTRPLSEAWTLDRLEEEYLRAVLKSTAGHKGRAAEHLGIDRRTLYRKLGELDARDRSRQPQELPDPTLPGTLY